MQNGFPPGDRQSSGARRQARVGRATADIAEAEATQAVSLREAWISAGVAWVDLAFAGDALYVAEKANSRVLRYDGVLGLRGLVDAAPDAAIAVDSAESVQLSFE